jgi:uncharacterized protein with HEPN domain
MRRSALAYLTDIVGCCDALAVALEGVDVAAYQADRTVRSAVERESTVIGEAVNQLSKLDPVLSTRITHARMIVGFRNLLIHDYPAIVDSAVWAIARNDAPVLRAECAALFDELRKSPAF